MGRNQEAPLYSPVTRTNIKEETNNGSTFSLRKLFINSKIVISLSPSSIKLNRFNKKARTNFGSMSF